MKTSVVYGIVVEEARPDTQGVAFLTMPAGGAVMVPNEEGAVVEAELVPKELDFGKVAEWDRKLKSYCEDNKMLSQNPTWWLITSDG